MTHPTRRQLTAFDRQIDQLVYELYGLSEEEIALVEAATAPREEPAADDSPAAIPAKSPLKKSKFWDG